jgi:cytolysin (calcineurin-like family phosphatase)
MIANRNSSRFGIEQKHTRAHYSWNWDNVHFINLNLMASNKYHAIPSKHKVRINGKIAVRNTNAFRSLDFLKNDLKKNVGKTKKKVVIMMHYPIIGSSRHSPQERASFYNAIKDYNVIAIIHGHSHQTAIRVWNKIPVLDVGAPFYNKIENKGKGYFTLVRISDERLEAVNYAWQPKEKSCLTGDKKRDVSLSPHGQWSVRRNANGYVRVTNSDGSVLKYLAN